MIPNIPLSKDELRQRLNLPYVCMRLGIVLDANGRGLCPVHEVHGSHTPSLRLWTGDDGTQLWWCDPCNIGGDVFSLIMRVEGCSFPGAIQRSQELLEELPPDYAYDVIVAPDSAGPDDWTQDIADGAARAVANPGAMAVSVGYCDATQVALAYQWDDYLRTIWGWGIDADGAILQPHWSPELPPVLTGCKVRRGTVRFSKKGSRFENLYGSWTGHINRDVLLTEGETDAAYAGWAARAAGIPIDVFGLPRGAGSEVRASWLSFLGKNVGVVYLAFDPDRAGVSATRKWIEALVSVGSFPDVRVCCLPLGQDLRAARPDLRTLLAAARRPLQKPDNLEERPGGYIRFTDKGFERPITTWTIEPVAVLSGGTEPGFDCLLHSRGIPRPTVIKLADLASTTTLNKWANKHDEVFTGSDSDRKVIAEMLKSLASVVPEIFQTDKVGQIDPPVEYSFGGKSVVYPDKEWVGQIPWRYTPTVQSTDVTGRVLLPYKGEELWKWEWLNDFIQLNETAVIHPLLAWLIASARRTETSEFPILFISGSSGVGKSTLAQLATRLMGSNMQVDLGGNTPFVLLRFLAASTSLPVFVDEWTRMSRKDTREQLQAVMPMLYSGGLAERGQGDLTVVTYQLRSPTIIAGEDTFSLDRETQRTIALTPTHAGQNPLALARISGRPIEQFGAKVHSWLTQRRAPEDELPAFPFASPTRQLHNRRILEAGWATLRFMLDEFSEHGEDVPLIPVTPDLSALDKQVAVEEGENSYEVALAEASSMRDSNGIAVVWADEAGRGTWVRFSSLLGLLSSRHIDIELPGRSRAMQAYFEERYGECTKGRVTPPGAIVAVRAHLIPGLQLEVDELAHLAGMLPQ